ncbi:hypothetical protein J7432_21595 [Xanthomonas axonopodis pv. begoniae]|nr:hypothetical protein [Xanthomonas axonopodis pv. begoniae]MBO9773970.1 hypothetical protein [Xanthomonas axonopodis pv. begoniae]PPT28894.1 hypothetical protein XabCFBP2524_22130 [Xanthomonas axonopodis pv. begoniae]
MAKTRAYTSEFGSEIVTAEAISRIRHLQYNGQPTGQRYFSTHRAGKRRPVKHVMKGRCFFAYVESGGNTSASDGETLNHLLFKEALALVQHTTLSLYRLTNAKPAHWIDVPICIKKAEPEKAIERKNGLPYRADLRIEFEDDKGLGLKWEDHLYIEIRHTHAVQAEKQMELRDLEIPVVEVAIPELFTYPIADDETSDYQEEVHRQRIKAILESESGFLKCVLLSDPSSKKYLRHVANGYLSKIKSLESEVTTLRSSLAASEEKLLTSAKKAANLSSQLQESQQAAEKHRSELDQASKELKNLLQQGSRLRRQRNWLILGCIVLSAGLGLMITW